MHNRSVKLVQNPQTPKCESRIELIYVLLLYFSVLCLLLLVNSFTDKHSQIAWKE